MNRLVPAFQGVTPSEYSIEAVPDPTIPARRHAPCTSIRQSQPPLTPQLSLISSWQHGYHDRRAVDVVTFNWDVPASCCALADGADPRQADKPRAAQPSQTGNYLNINWKRYFRIVNPFDYKKVCYKCFFRT